jgi:hypothetical protein
VSQALAAAHAEAELERYDAEQRRLEAASPSLDFDRLVAVSEKLGGDTHEKPVRGRKP